MTRVFSSSYSFFLIELCGQQKSCSLPSFSSSPPSLSTKVIVRAHSLARSAELFNVISFSIPSVDFFLLLLVTEGKGENLYLYLYTHRSTRKEKER